LEEVGFADFHNESLGREGVVHFLLRYKVLLEGLGMVCCVVDKFEKFVLGDVFEGIGGYVGKEGW
jgi:hypothetical protein